MLDNNIFGKNLEIADSEHIERTSLAKDVNLLEKTIDALKQENQKLNDKLLRSYADYHNFRRRTEENNQKQSEQAIFTLFSDLINIIDQLFIINSHWDSNNKSNNELIKNYLTELQSELENAGIQKIKTIGQKLDLTFHEVIKSRTVTNDISSDDYIVVSEIRSGYRYKDRVIRPALVEVALNQ